MRTIRFALLLASLALARAASAGEFRVAGYLPEYRLADFDLEAGAGLTDLMLFSAEPTPEGGLDLARLKKVPWDKLQAFKQKHHARLILSIGGWGRSDGFAAVAASVDMRRKFAEVCLEFCGERKFDGIDFDWEFPQGKSQQNDYAELLRDVRKMLPPEAFKLSVTIAGSQTIPTAAVEAVDWVQIMAYDYDGRHSTYEDAVKSVELRLKNNVPREKIVLGVPFYGRHVENRKSLTYREIVERLKPQASEDEAGGYYFNGPVTTARKVDYAIQQKLGGVMVWELGQDARGEKSLLNVIRERVGAAVE